MATRHLRKLQQQKEQLLPKHVSESEESDDEPATAAPFNPFDLLSDDEAEVATQDTDDEESTGASTSPATPSPLPARTSGSTGSKPSSKKKKKKSKKQSEPADSGATPADEEDIDALLQELNIPQADPSTSTAATSKGAKEQLSALLAVDTRLVQGDSELREIFGSDVIEAVEKEDALEAQRNRHRHRPMARGARPRRSLKRSVLVSPKEHWPPYSGGLAMECAGTKDGMQLFRYTHPPAYAQVQRAFEQCQASFDPNSVAALLAAHPYHVDALLAMYDLYRHMGENQYAEETLARALYAMEMAWHPWFSPSTGNCRLDFLVPENRPLFSALWRHIQALSRRGCHKSAMECCKLLLAMDPSDPLGALFTIDYLALRAASYAYLHRFAAGWPATTSLTLLPNFAFSLPLARFLHLHRRTSASTSTASSSGGSQRRGAAAAAAAAEDEAAFSGSRTAEEGLVEAALLHPQVVVALMERLQQQGVGKEGAWAAVLRRKLFSAAEAGSPTLAHLTSIYVERSHLLWKAADVQALLLEAASKAADIAEGKGEAPDGLSAEDWACVREETFPQGGGEGGEGGKGNEYRHLRLHEFSDAVNALPREELQQAMQAGGNMGDVEEAIAELQEQLLLAQQQAGAQQGGAGGARALTEEELQGANPIMMLLQSLLPWVNAGAQPDYGAEGGAGGAGGAAGGGGGGGAPPPGPAQ